MLLSLFTVSQHGINHRPIFAVAAAVLKWIHKNHSLSIQIHADRDSFGDSGLLFAIHLATKGSMDVYSYT